MEKLLSNAELFADKLEGKKIIILEILFFYYFL